MPYRTMPHRVLTPRPRYRWWLRPICLIFKHKWAIARVNTSKHLSLCHLHPMAGIDAVCLRCGLVWDDALPTPTCLICDAHAWEPCDAGLHS